MVPEKRYDILIKAFEIICNSHSEVRLIILGDGPLRKQIEKMVPVEIIERVRFLGFQNNPYYYMSHANVFVLTSDLALIHISDPLEKANKQQKHMDVIL